jgi:hypothetical protein
MYAHPPAVRAPATRRRQAHREASRNRLAPGRARRRYPPAVADILGFALFLGAFAGVLAVVWWLGTRIRRRGIGGGLMGPFDEMYNPGAQRARLEIEVQQEQAAPRPSPDDLWRGEPPRDGESITR